ncbi:nucleotide exchange factor GrpE [bacterium]|nr:nucleotide exchange factor GrpE [bacterium]MBU1994261.1 nucleotide exchange factor GrpE [bacterium]
MSKQSEEELVNEPLLNEEGAIEIKVSNSDEADAEAEAVENEFNLLQNELASLKDKYARVHADFDNIKKRLEREKYSAVDYANEKFAKDMIPVMDSLQMAIASASADALPNELLAKLKEGMELTLKQLTTSLEKHGVTMVSHDEPFDPNIHNAIQSVDNDTVQSGQIVQTFQTGYKYKGRPLREAMVVVAN